MQTVGAKLCAALVVIEPELSWHGHVFELPEALHICRHISGLVQVPVYTEGIDFVLQECVHSLDFCEL